MDELLAEIDEWCKRRAAGLVEKSNQHVLAGRSLTEPDYRLMLGEHKGYMAVRSFIHGTLRKPDTPS